MAKVLFHVVILWFCIVHSAMSGPLVAEERSTILRYLVENQEKQGKMLDDQSKQIQSFQNEIKSLQDEVKQLKQDACK